MKLPKPLVKTLPEVTMNCMRMAREPRIRGSEHSTM